MRGFYEFLRRCLFWVGLSAGFASPAVAGGFFFNLPPNYTTISSAKRNHVFYVGELVSFSFARTAARYEVRNYYGDLVSQGTLLPTARQLPLPGFAAPGWYQLYLYGTQDQGAPWGTVVGGTTFVIFRPTANFPPLPGPTVSGGADVAEDLIMRDLTAMGPQRFYVDDASKPDAAIAKLTQDIALEKANYLSYDPVRKRSLMIVFRNGVSGGDPAKIAGVKKIVQQFRNDVKYWEGKNEPNAGWTSGNTAAMTEQKPFYAAVKSVDPTLKVLGPAVTTLKDAPWLHEFLNAAGSSIDAFSFHAYNCVNGDAWLARQSLNDLRGVLQAHGLANIEKWQTEQGYFAAVYGSYQPRLQGRWTMLQMMVYEQYGIPKEHNYYFYDKSHGFWSYPSFFENEDGGLNPAAALMRVWSEELYGTTFSRAYAFGAAEENMYLGSLFTGPGKSVAAFMSAGSTTGSVTLAVNGASLKLISAFGQTAVMPIVGGRAKIPVTELPTYVELAAGQTCEVVLRGYGENLARRPGVTVTVNEAADAGAAKLVNGQLENWYYSLSDATAPWKLMPAKWPVTVEVTLPTTEVVSDALIYAAVPWQSDCTLVDYDFQYWDGAKWVTIEHVSEPLKTWKVFSPPVRCTVESFFSDRCIFEHHFAPVTTKKLRLVVNNVTFGGGATKDVLDAGGQPGYQRVVLRELEIYRRP